MKAISLLAVAVMVPVMAVAKPCGFVETFSRPDEKGTMKVPVFEGNADPAIGGKRPIAFISDLKVNTDGTRISYKVDDPRAQHGAINDMRNAMLSGKTIADFIAVANAGWPLPKTWSVLSADVIEKKKQTGKPCVAPDNYMVSMTADVSVPGGWDKVGDCDQAKWIDALTIPALVLPKGSTEFEARKAGMRNFVVAMTIAEPHRLAIGIVGDKGPVDELGEASVAMNRTLNGLPETALPKNRADANERFQGPKSVILILPGPENRAALPLTLAAIKTEVEKRFGPWGGKERLRSCVQELTSH